MDLAPLQAVAPQIIGADDSVRSAADRLAAIDASALVRQVAGPVAQLRDLVDEVGTTVGTAAKAAVLLPSMLGAGGPREYLVLVPGTLALVLGATGPVRLPDGETLTADNAVPTLLNDVYLCFAKPADQDAHFAVTAAAVFKAVVDGQGDATRSVDALAEAARRGRLMIWSSHKDEQARLAGTVLDGALRGPGDSPVIGVYLNDGTQAKLDYYLTVDIKGTVTRCRADGTRVVDVTATLTAGTPAGLASMPDYLVGNGEVVRRGVTRTNVVVYAPGGGRPICIVSRSAMTATVAKRPHETETTREYSPGPLPNSRRSRVRPMARAGPRTAGSPPADS